MELKWSGNGKDMEWKERESNHIRMDSEMDGKGIEWNFGIIVLESLHWNFAKFLSIPLVTVPSNSIPFHRIPLSI